MATPFWTEGPDRLHKALRSKSRELDRLRRELHHAGSEDESRSLEEQIHKLLEEYSAAKDELDRSVFISNRR